MCARVATWLRRKQSATRAQGECQFNKIAYNARLLDCAVNCTSSTPLGRMQQALAMLVKRQCEYYYGGRVE